MKLLKWFGLVALAAIAIFLIVGFLLPQKYRVERSVVIAAPPAAIFPTVNTLKEWPTWTAWTALRFPDMKVSFEGPDAGVGATYGWTGKEVGVGKVVITASRPDQEIGYDLDFENGQFLSTGGIQLAAAEDGKTKVTWWNEGELGMNPINRYCGLMMDGMMGPDFQKGLDNLKRRAETVKPETAATR